MNRLKKLLATADVEDMVLVLRRKLEEVWCVALQGVGWLEIDGEPFKVSFTIYDGGDTVPPGCRFFVAVRDQASGRGTESPTAPDVDTAFSLVQWHRLKG
jgi:hypothetical protein